MPLLGVEPNSFFQCLFCESNQTPFLTNVFGKPLNEYFCEDPDMKCSIMLSSGSTLFLRVKKIFRQKKIQYCLKNYNMTPLGMYIRLSQVYCINQKEGSISIQRANVLPLLVRSYLDHNASPLRLQYPTIIV